MSKRKNIKTTIQQVVEYWSANVDECGLSIDWAEADTRCWRCGCERKLERCHIVPDCLGGEDAPHNLVLLCKRCHIDGPNVTDPEIMWDWIRAYSVPLYDTFWHIIGLKEYQFIYKVNFTQEVIDILNEANLEFDDGVRCELQEMTRTAIENAGVHFGHPYLNVATMAGINRMVLKMFAAKRHVPFPLARKQSPLMSELVQRDD